MARLSKEILALVRKEFVLEWRERSAFNGILLYTFSTIFVCYLSFNQRRVELNPVTWNTLFWIIQLFAAIHGISKSFSQERGGRFYFYYSLVSPQAIILSKIIYNTILMSLISMVGFLIYTFVMGSPVIDLPLFILNLLLGAVGFASTLTMVSGISSKSTNSSTLMAVLGFPVILPMILMLIKVSKNAMDGLARNLSYDEVLTIFAIDVIVVTVSYILFPYLWRS
ncbi:heme exporter protein CcmB [Limibacter armeniacum]|uniref:heme exporter protein CcmB n=1 Tax=Limibacter armeniacum TaxID=466084 RepID=UPI002FE5C7C6